MYRLAYRNINGHGALVVNHSVTVGSGTGIRWYELRADNSSPDSNLTVDAAGNVRPVRHVVPVDGKRGNGLRRQHRPRLQPLELDDVRGPRLHGPPRAGEPAGTMTQGETVFKTGGRRSDDVQPLGRLLEHEHRPGRRLHLLVHGRVHPEHRRLQLEDADRLLQLPGCAAAGVDSFSLALVPTSLTVVQGASDSTAVNTAITSGAAQSVDLSATGAPYHTTISFTPPTISSGDSTSMNVDVGDDTPAGTYTISVRGTGPKDIETATFTLTVKRYNAVVNGDFENGLTGWTVSGSPAPIVVAPKPSKKGTTATPAHAAQIGTKTGVGDFTLSQLVTVPTGTTGLSFWYQPHCANTKTDTFVAQIRDPGGTPLQTLVSACTKSCTWLKGAYDTSALAGQNVTLWFSVHSAKSSKAAYALVDDVVLGRQPAGVANGGFETGDLTGWSPAGDYAAVGRQLDVRTPGRARRCSERAAARFHGDSALSQAVIVPGINPTLTVWYFPHCRDTIAFDQIQIQIKSPGGQVLSTLLNTCPSSTKSWRWTTGDVQPERLGGPERDDLAERPRRRLPRRRDVAQFDDVALTGG